MLPFWGEGCKLVHVVSTTTKLKVHMHNLLDVKRRKKKNTFSSSSRGPLDLRNTKFTILSQHNLSEKIVVNVGHNRFLLNLGQCSKA